MWLALRRRTAPLFLSPARLKSTNVDAEAKFKTKVLELEAESTRNLPEWAKREQSLRKRYGAWNPTRKLSRQQIWDIRELKAQWPQMKTKQLADHFHINPESIRRILKSKWNPSEDELASINERAERRKKESQQRKQKADVATKLPKLSLPASKPAAKRLAAKRHRKHGENQRNFDKKPFTVGVGDLID